MSTEVTSIQVPQQRKYVSQFPRSAVPMNSMRFARSSQASIWPSIRSHSLSVKGSHATPSSKLLRKCGQVQHSIAFCSHAYSGYTKREQEDFVGIAVLRVVSERTSVAAPLMPMRRAVAECCEMNHGELDTPRTRRPPHGVFRAAAWNSSGGARAHRVMHRVTVAAGDITAHDAYL